MPNYKHVVKVNRKKEEHLYRLMKGLELTSKNGKKSYEIKSTDDEWHGAMRAFGKRAKELFDDDFIGKPWYRINQETKKILERKIPVKENTIINEKIGNELSFFHFKRRKVI